MDEENNQRALNRGRDPSLRLLTETHGEQSLEEAAQLILSSMMAAAELLDGANATTRHGEAVKTAQARIIGDQETPSARVIRELSESQIDYSVLMGRTEQWNQMFRKQLFHKMFVPIWQMRRSFHCVNNAK